MRIKDHFDKDNLHHAYLIEGNKEEVKEEILDFLSDISYNISNNPDFFQINFDTIKIDDARDIKSLTTERTADQGKRIFIISANSLLIEAQNTLLKIFEEPIEHTHFFLIVPSVDTLVKTLVSRFYLIKEGKIDENFESKEVINFLKMSLKERFDFIKVFLTEDEDDEEEQDSPRSKAIRFIDQLEKELSKKLENNKNKESIKYFEHIFKVREFLRQPGSAPKMLLESVAIVVPKL